MRLVKLKEFLTLPAGTLYMEYDPCVFRSLRVKQDTVPGTAENIIPDFTFDEVTYGIKGDSLSEQVDLLDSMVKDSKKDASIDFDTTTRDGMFDPDKIFAVYSEKDMYNLILKVTESWKQVKTHNQGKSKERSSLQNTEPDQTEFCRMQEHHQNNAKGIE